MVPPPRPTSTMWASNRVSVLLHMEAGNHVHIGRCRVRVKIYYLDTLS